jgi:hypothetical protein
VGKETEGGAHQRRGRQHGCDSNAAGLGLLWRQRLDEEAWECEGGSALLEKGRKWGRERKGGVGGGGGHFKGGRWRGAEEGVARGSAT